MQGQSKENEDESKPIMDWLFEKMKDFKNHTAAIEMQKNIDGPFIDKVLLKTISVKYEFKAI